MLSKEDFLVIFRNSLSVGQELQNPQSGTSRILKIDDKITYQRGISRISIALNDVYDVYKTFNGKKVYTTDLRQYKPEVFDSKARPAGHSCNCTFVFLAFKEMNLVKQIQGQGVVNKPYYIEL